MNDSGRPLPPLDSSPRPTNVRWVILAILMAQIGVCHFNRISISVAGTEHIIKEHSLTDPQMGAVYTAYLAVYTLLMIPGGWLIDRFGPKRALLLVGFGSVVLVPVTGLTGLFAGASILLPLFIIRGLLGAVSAPKHPGAARAVSFWMPPQTRGMANGLVTGAAVVGIASTYYLFGSLSDLVGWKMAFVVSGAVTLLPTLAWAKYATDRPDGHPSVNVAERALIEGDATAAPPPKEQTSWGDFFSLVLDSNLILLTLSYALYSYLQYLFFYWLEHYFKEVMHLGVDQSRLYTTIPNIAMAVGMILGGAVGDLLQRQFGGSRGRAASAGFGMVGCSVSLLLGLLSSHPTAVVTFFSLAMGLLGFAESSFWVTAVQIGRHRGGLAGGILNAGGNLGGVPAPYVAPLISSKWGWPASLAVAAGLCLLGAMLWWGIRPDKDSSTDEVETA